MTFYYRNPQPDRFVSEVRKLSRAGALSAPNARSLMAAFLSRLMADHPEKIAEWMAALADLPDNDKRILNEAIWYSNTDAGKAYLRERGLHVPGPGMPLLAPDMLQEKIESPVVLDQLWGYFLATGDETPVRQVVSALNYYQYVGATVGSNTSPRTPHGEPRAYYEGIFRTALLSLDHHCRQHPRVREICHRLLEGGDLNPTERECLKVVLAKLKR